MADLRIWCVNKPDRNSPHEHITHLGNPYQGGWCGTRKQIIANIDAGMNTFFTIDPVTGKRADVEVVRELGKAPYLRTYADGKWNNNLLALPECTGCRL